MGPEHRSDLEKQLPGAAHYQPTGPEGYEPLPSAAVRRRLPPPATARSLLPLPLPPALPLQAVRTLPHLRDCIL